MRSFPRSAAALAAAAVSAQGVAAVATRDALFLTSLDFTALPAMFLAAAVLSLAALALHARASRLAPPEVLMPRMLAASGALFLAEWLLRASAPVVVGILVYLHVSAAAALIASGFWLLIRQANDPLTPARRIAPVAAAAMVGGVLGAAAAERIAATAGTPAILLWLGVAQFVAAWLVGRALRRRQRQPSWWEPAGLYGEAPARSGLRLVSDSPRLQSGVLLVLLTTTSGALLDYLFKANAVGAFGTGDNLLRFFAIYYGAIAVGVFVLQVLVAGGRGDRFGVSLLASAPSLALLAGGATTLVAPGVGTLLVARGSEAMFRGSWFDAAGDNLYAPLSAAERPAAQSTVQVAAERVGDAVGGGLMRLAMTIAPSAHSSTILSLAMITALAGVLAAWRFSEWCTPGHEGGVARAYALQEETQHGTWH
jgi:hypothetical protein